MRAGSKPSRLAIQTLVSKENLIAALNNKSARTVDPEPGILNRNDQVIALYLELIDKRMQFARSRALCSRLFSDDQTTHHFQPSLPLAR